MKLVENDHLETELERPMVINKYAGPKEKKDEEDDLGEDLDDEDINADDYDDEEVDPDFITENDDPDDFELINRPDSGLDEDAPDTDSL